MFSKLSAWIKDKKSKLLSAAGAILAVALLYLFYHVTGIGCPIKFISGISCPGCGMTRACISVARFRFAEACYFHPLVYCLPFAALVFLLRKRISNRIYKILIFTFIALFVTIYIVRMCDPFNDVVTFHPEQGFLFRTIQFFFT